MSGAPATGKTVVLSAIARLFQGAPSAPPHVKGAAVPIPKGSITASQPWLPAPAAKNRAVFHTVFHQNSKYRDFVSGLMPDLGTAGKFTVSKGVLLAANAFASQLDSAALLIIDELNRGPAVQLFGGAIVAMEHDKRGDGSGAAVVERSVGFDALTTSGQSTIYLSSDLFIVGVMNQADTSVEALDVAFLRRWEPYPLLPSIDVLTTYFGIPPVTTAPSAAPTGVPDVYVAAARAWAAVNERVSIGRGPEYAIGHGVFMAEPPAATTQGALEHVSRAWNRVLAHVEEIFFGDPRGIAAVLNLLTVKNPSVRFETLMFGDEPRERVVGPRPVPPSEIYDYLLAIAADGPP